MELAAALGRRGRAAPLTRAGFARLLAAHPDPTHPDLIHPDPTHPDLIHPDPTHPDPC